jgi:hypothetical protein
MHDIIMKTKNISEYFVSLLQESFFAFIEGLKRLNFFKRKVSSSLLCYNIAWFTNCTWIEQLIAFDKISYYLDNKLSDYSQEKY